MSSSVVPPVTGGGMENASFLQGGAAGPNAQSAKVNATFWIDTLADGARLQLQYSQTVLLNFKGLSWPHVTVGTLSLMQGKLPPIQWLDPKTPLEMIPKP